MIDLSKLLAVWIDQIIDSPLALDPFIGPAVVNCIETFLRLRGLARPRAVVAPAGDSQDEYGRFDEFDLDDPVLNAMLGITAPDDFGAASQDMMFAEVRLWAILNDGFPQF